jgi:hypothetical protein
MFLIFGKPANPSKAWIHFKGSDVAQLESPTDLIDQAPVKFDLDHKNYSTSDNFYSAGYPGKTEFFSNGVGDATGGKLVVTVGKVIGVSLTQMVVQASTLGKTGMSGAPLINKDGRILGVYCTGKRPEFDKPDTARANFFILDKDALETLWSSFQF